MHSVKPTVKSQRTTQQRVAFSYRSQERPRHIQRQYHPSCKLFRSNRIYSLQETELGPGVNHTPSQFTVNVVPSAKPWMSLALSSSDSNVRYDGCLQIVVITTARISTNTEQNCHLLRRRGTALHLSNLQRP